MRKLFIFICLFIIGNIAFSADFSVFKLDNGQTVIIEEVHTNPIVTIDTWVKTGSINENDKNNGVSHFLEHLFFKGTAKHPVGEFDKTLESKGAINNAATSKDFTHYYITIPSKDFDLALEMHADMLQNPQIPENELNKERKVVIEEICKDINSPSAIVYDNLTKLLYKNHPYKRKVIGKSEIIENITRDEILGYFNTYYAPSNMVTIVVGDVDTQKVLSKIKQEFKSNFRNTPQNSYPKDKTLTSQKRNIAYTDTQSGYLLIGFRGVKATENDAYALDVLSTILGDGRSSVFYKNIKDKKQLAFNISASNGTFKDDGIFYISANFTPDNLEKLEENIFAEITKIQKNGVTAEQIQLAKNIIEHDTYYARESVSNIAQEIGYTMVVTGDIKFYNNYIENIKKVTANDVKRVANKYLNSQASAVSVVLPEQAKEVKISHITPLDTSAELLNQNAETQKFKLPNNAILLLTPNSANDIIAISIIAKGGEFIENVPGTGKLTSSMMLKGTKNYSSEELSQMLEDSGIKIVPSSKADMFSINVLTTKTEYDKTLKLLNEIVNNATFDNYELEKIKKEKLNQIKKKRDIPLQKAIEEYLTLIYQGSVYSNSNKVIEKTIPQIKRDDLVKFYEEIFAPQNLIISINGNVDKDKTISELTKIFNLKNGEKFDYNKYSVPNITTQRISTQIDKNTQTDWLLISWQTDGITNLKDYATLQVIDSLLGTGMSSRLFRNLRESEGLAYQLGSSFSPHMLRGNFTIYIGTNSQTLEHSKSKLFDEINKLKTEYVGTKELQEAKDKIIGQFVIGQETNLEKASLIGWFETSERGYDFKNQYEKLINSVTETDIIDVANKYFNNNYVMSIVKN